MPVSAVSPGGPPTTVVARTRHSWHPGRSGTSPVSKLEFNNTGRSILMTRTVLLVDDDADVLHCLTRMLQRQPYQLYTARSGDEAVTLLKCRQVDVIVADERMPGMSGTDLLAWVARNYPDVVCIMLTGQASIEAVMRAINEGSVFHVFTKPCNEVDLAIMIRKALEHKDILEKQSQLRGRGPKCRGLRAIRQGAGGPRPPDLAGRGKALAHDRGILPITAGKTSGPVRSQGEGPDSTDRRGRHGHADPARGPAQANAQPPCGQRGRRAGRGAAGSADASMTGSCQAG